MASNVDINKFIAALETSVNPCADAAARAEAITLCEGVKNGPQCASIGFRLAEKHMLDARLRYFGLQLVHHKVRWCWTEIRQNDQGLIKERVISLIRACDSAEPKFIKAGLASVLTEIVKHTWPQKWPNMAQEVIARCIAPNNPHAVEIALLMFLGLAEDVAVLQNVPLKHRARDLRQGLSLASGGILTLLYDILSSKAQKAHAPEQAHLAEVCIGTIVGYAEWVKVEYLFANGQRLPKLVCGLLQKEQLRFAAAECLLVMATRRGKPDEKLAVLQLAQPPYVATYADVCRRITDAAVVEPRHFAFLHKMACCVETLGGLLMTVLEQEKNDAKKAGLIDPYRDFLDLLFSLVSHPSRCVAGAVVPSWLQLLRVYPMRSKPTLLQCVPALLGVIARTVVRTAWEGKFAECETLQFNDDEERDAFYRGHRTKIADLLKACTKVLPLSAVDDSLRFMRERLAYATENADWKESDWESVLFYAENVMSCVLLPACEEHEETAKLPISDVEQLYRALLAPEVAAKPQALQAVLNCSYTLLRLLVLSPNVTDHLKLLVDRIFKVLESSHGQPLTAEMKLLRQQCSSLMIRLGKTYAMQLVPLFDYLLDLVSNFINRRPAIFSPFEQVHALEMLILVSVATNDHALQSRVVEKSVSTANDFINSERFLSGCKSPQAFAAASGLCQEAGMCENEGFAEFRRCVYYYTALFQAVLNRSRNFKAEAGLANPCADHVLTAIDNCLMLLQLFSALYSPEVEKAIHPDYRNVFDMRPSERKWLVHVENASSVYVQTPADDHEYLEKPVGRLQNFIIAGLETCLQIVGFAGEVLGSRFYAIPQLKDVIIGKALSNVASMPPLRMKTMLRLFFGPFVKHCPLPRVDAVVAPILDAYCRFMAEKLQPEWDVYAGREAERLRAGDEAATAANGDECQMEQEMVNEQLLRQITREYLEFLIALVVNKQPAAKSDQEEAKREKATVTALGGGHITQLTDLGALVAATATGEVILCTALLALSFHDTQCCFKGMQILWPMMKHAFARAHPLPEDGVRNMFEGVLRGLHRHGQHEGCEMQLQSLALAIVHHARAEHRAALARTLRLAAPERSAGQIDDFFERFERMNEKNRKYRFKQLVQPVIEKPLGEQFKEIPKMLMYEKLVRKERATARPGLGESEVQGVALLFQPDADGVKSFARIDEAPAAERVSVDANGATSDEMVEEDAIVCATTTAAAEQVEANGIASDEMIEEDL